VRSAAVALLLILLLSPAAVTAQTSAPADSSAAPPPAAPPPAVAEPSAAPADTGNIVYPPATPPIPHGKIESHLERTSEERHRFEIGAARPNEFFDMVGTFGYRRFMREGGPFEQSLMVEASGTGKDYLAEGSIGAYYLLRPMKSYKEEWKIRPLIEAGPGGHLTVQVASIEGFNEQSFHAKGFLKAHLYGGFEFLLSRKWGFLVRGRLTAPENKPFDYAQAAILLR
jgi:hypothetical protein